MSHGRNTLMSLCLVLAVLLGSAAWVSATEIGMDDCGKCHAFQVKMLAMDGGSHARLVACVDCHQQHPPDDDAVTLLCSACHDGNAHYRLDDCRHCHVDPHMPLTHLRDPIKPARKECLSCHAEVGQQMRDTPSRHAQLFCNRCHSRHKEIPGCLDCHGPHLPQQTETDCRTCHSAHRPKDVTLARHVPSSFCSSCHARQARGLSLTHTRHGGINCIYCHRGNHPSTTDCRDCHGIPHIQAIHRQHADCLTCHEDAHRLVSGR